MNIKTFAAAAVLALAPAIAGATTAPSTIIGFDALDASNGQNIPLLSLTEGQFSFDLTFGGRNDGPAIFDTTCAAYGAAGCSADPDLELTADRQGERGVGGNVLILQEEGSTDIDDSALRGGTVTFTLTEGPAFYLTGYSILDDITVRVAEGATFDRANEFGRLATPVDNGTNIRRGLDSPLFQVGDSFTFFFNGSGAIDSLQLAPVPLPAGILLMLGGLGGLAALRRRQRTA